MLARYNHLTAIDPPAELQRTRVVIRSTIESEFRTILRASPDCARRWDPDWDRDRDRDRDRAKNNIPQKTGANRTNRTNQTEAFQCLACQVSIYACFFHFINFLVASRRHLW